MFWMGILMLPLLSTHGDLLIDLGFSKCFECFVYSVYLRGGPFPE